MKNKEGQDERVIMVRRKIQSDGYQILVFGLLVAILIQEYLLQAPFSQYAVEVVLCVVAGGYVLIRNLKEGNDIFDTKKAGQTTVILSSLVCGFVTSTSTTILNYMNYADKIKMPVVVHIALVFGMTFIIGTVTAYIGIKAIYLANRKRQKSIEVRLNEGENEDE